MKSCDLPVSTLETNPEITALAFTGNRSWLMLFALQGSSSVPKLSEATIEVLDNPRERGLVGWAGLMAAVVCRARHEVKAGSEEALEWLAGDDCADYCIAIGFDHRSILNWVNKFRKSIERIKKMDEKVIELRKKIAVQMGLPGIIADWLRGETEEDIKKDAEKLIDFLKPGTLHLDINSMSASEIRANADQLWKQTLKQTDGAK